MGFRFHRRLNLGGGAGLNVSKSGVGASVRSRHGSIGTKGFSLRTGIPGLSYRQSWGKGGNSGAGSLVFAVIALAALAVVALVQMVTWLMPLVYQGGRWCVLTAQDYIEYRRTGRQPNGDLEPIEADPPYDPNAKTLAEIMAGESTLTPPPAPVSALPRTQLASSLSSSASILETAGGRPAPPTAVVTVGVGLALATLLGLSHCIGGSNEPSFDGADLSSWHAVMVDEHQLASVRLSNADAILSRFPSSSEAATAQNLRSQLVEASGAEAIQREAESVARAAERQSLIDRKERRSPIANSVAKDTSSQTAGRDAAIVATGAALVATHGTGGKRAGPQAQKPAVEARPAQVMTRKRTSALAVRDETCPCSASFNCTGPRGGLYCITSGGKKRYRSRPSASVVSSSGSCPCSGSRDCVGPRGGHYCFTSGDKKRYR